MGSRAFCMISLVSHRPLWNGSSRLPYSVALFALSIDMTPLRFSWPGVSVHVCVCLSLSPYLCLCHFCVFSSWLFILFGHFVVDASTISIDTADAFSIAWVFVWCPTLSVLPYPLVLGLSGFGKGPSLQDSHYSARRGRLITRFLSECDRMHWEHGWVVVETVSLLCIWMYRSLVNGAYLLKC